MRTFVMILLLALPLAAVERAEAAKDIRDIMLESAMKKDRSFPDSKSVKLTSFAYVCKLRVETQTLHVVNQKQVLTEMPAPRGVRYVSLFDERGRYLTKYRYDSGEPLWCEGEKLYLWGSYSGPLPGECKDGCNVMKFDASGHATLLREKAYGSSGGTLD